MTSDYFCLLNTDTFSAVSVQNGENNSEVNHPDDPESRNLDVKVLLLGSAESGKSTLIKQLKIIHDNGFREDERILYKV